MNDLLSTNSFVSRTDDHRVIDMNSAAPSNTTTDAAGASLEKFFGDVEAIKEEMKELERISQSLKSSHEENKALHEATAVKHLRSRMDADVALALKKAKLLKLRLEALDHSNASARGLPGCGPDSSSDRTRTSVVNGLKRKLKDSMDTFNDLRQQISSEYRETVKRRYFTVTGENPDDQTVELLIATGESESFLQKAIQEQGKGRILDTINEIQERHDAVKELERSLMELHQVFLDMAVLVQSQDEHLNDIETYVTRASSFVKTGVQELHTAKKHQKNTRKWTCYAIFFLLVIVLIVVLAIAKPWQHKGSSAKN